jgi:hypothetical protein
LTEWASHGFIVFAKGVPEVGIAINEKDALSSGFEEAIAFIGKSAGIGNYTQVDASRIGICGMATAGSLAYDLALDSRVTSVMVMSWSSGFDKAKTTVKSSEFKTPTAYLLGGTSDPATSPVSFKLLCTDKPRNKLTHYLQSKAEKDMEAIPEGTPKWQGSLETSQQGTYCQPHGGQFGTASSNWWRWTLRGDSRAGEFF